VIRTQKRIDGRDLVTVRPIDVEVGLLPRVHGSGLFTRGETQVLAVVTLGTREDEQIQDNIRLPRTKNNGKKFMLHYNFPPFSVGEAGFMRGPGRREIGHGNLAERALLMMAPAKEEFPYTIRIVAETLESNGSSSMGSVCSGTMALLDAGVPLKKPVAGIAMGLIQQDSDTVILTDILGDEDHLGDMDFKVAGTKDGITAIQMDIKIEGVTEQILDKALSQARDGRLHILNEMARAITEARPELSPHAPRLYTMKVNPEKIAAIIGTGGKVIRGIIEQCDVKIDIDDDGSVNIAATDGAKAAKARGMIEAIIEEVQVNKTYNGTITRIVDFGAFVEIIPGTEGLLHVSEIAYERVQNVRDHLKEGDKIDVKVLDIDRTGKMRLSRKALLERPAGMPEDDGGGDFGGRSGGGGGGGFRGGDRGPRGGGGGGRDRGGPRGRF
jgi:polyribonucleotide nucleotidyltransferase